MMMELSWLAERPVTIYSNRQSLFMAVECGANTVATVLNGLCFSERHITLLWMTEHEGVRGNELAEVKAKISHLAQSHWSAQKPSSIGLYVTPPYNTQD